MASSLTRGAGLARPGAARRQPFPDSGRRHAAVVPAQRARRSHLKAKAQAPGDGLNGAGPPSAASERQAQNPSTAEPLIAAPSVEAGIARRGTTALVVNSKAKILQLLAEGSTNYQPGKEMESAVKGLTSQNPSEKPAEMAHELGQGTWEVFYAPHIVNLSTTFLGTKFDPITYIFKDDKIISNVKFTGPVVGTGWLSSSGTYKAVDAYRVQIQFDQFWVDMGDDSLRKEFVERKSKVTVNPFSWTKAFTDAATIDKVIGTVGRAAFFPSFSVFPILYLDDDLAVFRFDPLSSNIAVKHTDNPAIRS